MIFILVRRNSLKSKSLNYEFIYYKHTALSLLNVSFWRHPFTAKLESKLCNAKFL